MIPFIATVICVIGILTLLVLERRISGRPSWALWLPMIWFLISGSRHVSAWFGMVQSSSPDSYTEGSPVDAAIYALLIFIAVVVLIGRQKAVFKLLRNNWPILLFVAYCAVSILWSDFPEVALKRWIKSLGDYAMVLILLTEHDRETAIKQVLSRVGIILMPLSILFIKYYPAIGRTYATHWAGTQFFVGVSDNKNMLGMACMIFGFAAYCMVLEVLHWPRRSRIRGLFVYGTVAAFAIWILRLSNSMTSLSCFVLVSGIITAFTFVKPLRKKAVINFLVVSVIFVCVAVLFLGIGSGALSQLGRNSTLTGRTDMWAVLLSEPINPIIGTGFESFWLGPRLVHLWTFPIVSEITEAHNGYLEMYLNLGWIGESLLAILLLTGYRNIQRLLSRDPEAGRIRLGYFVIAVVYNFTEAGFRSGDLIWISFVLAIIALPVRLQGRTSRAETPYAESALAGA